jgi:hypothetical protein
MFYGGVGTPNAGGRADGFFGTQLSYATDSYDSPFWRRWMFWGKRAADPPNRYRLHVPLASDIASTSADLLFSEPVALLVADAHLTNATQEAKDSQERIDDLGDENGWNKTFLEAAEVDAALGGVFLRATWDRTFADRPLLTAVHPDAAVPEFRYGVLSAVTFWKALADDGQKVYRHLERHEPGHIIHGLYEGSRRQLGRQIALSSLPETASLMVDQDLATQAAGLFLDVATGLKDLTAVYIPNARPDRQDRRSPLGRSDYSGTEGMLDALDEVYCVDAETEALTDHGWVRHGDLHPDDKVLTLNHETGLSEWQPVLEVCVFPAVEREMVSIESRSHSSLTTPDHRWPVIRPHYRWKGSNPDFRAIAGHDRCWATSDTIQFEDRIPLTAQCGDLPDEPTHSDALVEAVAWFWTEGHIRKLRDGTLGGNVMITQRAASTDHCARIRSALTRLFGPAVAAMPRTGKAPTDGAPRWREDIRGSARRNIVFQLSSDAGALLQTFAPGRVPTHNFLRSLTRPQLTLFLEASMLADNSGDHSLAQKDRAAAEAFQFACILAGYAASLKPTSGGRDKYPMWNVRLRSQESLWAGRPGVRRRVAYSGVVWCPRTPNQTWLARRHGTVYFTGNTSWMREVRLCRARILVPEQMLEGKGKGQGATFDPDREVFMGLNSLADDGENIQFVQPAIRTAEHLTTTTDLVNRIVQTAGYSPSSFGLPGDGRIVTATEVAAREQRSLVTRAKKASYWGRPLADIVERCLQIDHLVFGGPVPYRPDIKFADSVQQDPKDEATALQLLHAAASVSTDTRVRMLHPDWGDDQVAAEVQRIQAELGVAVPDPMAPPTITTSPAQPAPNGQPAEVPQ